MEAVCCQVCMHHCMLKPGQWGRCRARKNEDGEIRCGNYGRVTSLNLDPIEKKPLRLFHPGSLILSVGSYGCNLRCPFCQNHEISMKGADTAVSCFMSPKELAERAEKYRPVGNIGAAFTYNEPLVGWEYVRDTARLIHTNGMKNVLVTNGTASLAVLEELLPYVGENDGYEEMEEEAAWIASVSRDIPLHVTRFFPRYHMTDREATEVERVYRLAETAGKYLNYVFTGNC